MAHSSHSHHHDGDRLIHWPRIYDLTTGLLGRRGTRLRRMFADDLQLAPGDHVLDVGCGPGRLTRFLAKRVAPDGAVDGIDASPQMIKRAAAKAHKQGIPANFQVGYAQDLPFADNSFDAVACILVLHHVAADDQLKAAAEMHRVLKPGGRLLIAEFQAGPKHPHPGPRWLRRSMDEDMINKGLSLVTDAGFSGIVSAETNLGWLGKITARK
jgi:ubiquinone/menaquinone biosynthesis C-methylase UbiE